MDSSSSPPGRPRSLHDALGGGIVADVMLWRRRSAATVMLLGTLASSLLFQVLGYTLLSLLSSVLLLLTSIFFLWAKAARILNRPLPPIPEMHISEEVINKAKNFILSHLNMMLSVLHDIVLGKDPSMFYEVAACLWMISILGNLTDFPTFIYTCIVVALTIPALYEKYEECIDKYMKLAYIELQMYERIYERVSIKWFYKAQSWIEEILKEN